MDRAIQQVHARVKSYMQTCFRTTEERTGWPRSEGGIVSVTNTTEALLTYSYIGALDDPFVEQHRDAVCGYLKASLAKALDSKAARTRDVSYSAIGLELLGERLHRDAVVGKLQTMATADGGWPLLQGYEADASLVSTYHALLGLHYLGAPIHVRHLEWIKSLRQPDGLVVFNPRDIDSSFGASCLALFLCTLGDVKDHAWVHNLGKSTKERLLTVFASMNRSTNDWVSEDRHSNFKIFGYGHGLVALHRLGENLFDLNISDFINTSAASACNVPELALDVNRTWVPAVLEFAMALRAIQDNFDPYELPKLLKKEVGGSLRTQLDAERERLAGKARRLELLRAVTEEAQKDLARQRSKLRRDALELPVQTASILEARLEARSRRRLKAAKAWLIVFLLVAIVAAPLIWSVLEGEFSFRDARSWLFMVLSVAASLGAVPLSRFLHSRLKPALAQETNVETMPVAVEQLDAAGEGRRSPPVDAADP